MYLSCLLINAGTDPDRPRPGRWWLRNRYRVHQRLCMAFPSRQRRKQDPQLLKPWAPADFPEQRHLAGKSAKDESKLVLQQVHAQRDERSGFLFRIDPQPGGQVVILVQSAVEPDWNYAFHNARHFLAAPPQVRQFDPCFETNQRLQFRLVANPTRKIDTKSGSDGRRRHGKRVPVPTHRLHEWLNRRAGPCGFCVERLTDIQPGYLYFNKPLYDKVRKGDEIAQNEKPEKERTNGQRLRSVRYDGILKITDSARFQETLVRGIGPAKAFGFGLLSVAPA